MFSSQIVAFSSIVPHIILRRQKIILDLTACGSHPIDISGDSSAPTEITEPTAPIASATMCEALKAITIEDGSFCSVDRACDALECEIGDHRLEIAMESCHHPPGVRVEMYDGANQRLFHTSLYNGTHNIHDKNLPFNMNVSIQQLLSNRVCVEVCIEMFSVQ